MTKVVAEETWQRRPHPVGMAEPFVEFDLSRELDQLLHEPEWKSGRTAKTLAKYDDLRVVLTALKPHMTMEMHRTDGRISIQGVRGHVVLRAEGRTFNLTPGRVVTFDRRIPHELEAIDESAVLQTIVWPAA